MRTRTLAAALTFLFACGGEAPPTTSTVRDSAGITIVENDAPAWGPGEAWRVSQEPVVSIGVAEGAEEYQLFRANGALRLPGGDILIINGGTSELRFYDSTGTYLHAVGREGAGPGEYNMMGGVARFLADSLLVLDFGNDRMVVLGPRGEFGRTFKTQPAPGASRGFLRGPFPDGSLLAQSYLIEGSGMQQGLTRRAVLYSRYDASIIEASRNYSIPEPFIRAVIRMESDYDPRVVSIAGAQGLMQLMPGTAKRMNVKNPFDPHDNIMGGTRYLRHLANMFGGDMVLTIAGYHAGEGAVLKYGGVPPYSTTKGYIRRVLKFYYRYKKRAGATG